MPPIDSIVSMLPGPPAALLAVPEPATELETPDIPTERGVLDVLLCRPPRTLDIAPAVPIVVSTESSRAAGALGPPAPTSLPQVTSADRAVPTEPSPPTDPKIDGSESASRNLAGNLSAGESSLATYWIEGDPSLLARAVVAFRAALSQAPDGSEEKIKAQIGLADALRLEVDEGTGGDGHFEESLSLAESAATAAASLPELYPESLRALGEVLFDRNRQKTTERLQRAVDTFCRLVDVTSDSPPAIAAQSLALYAQALNAQWRDITGDPKLVDLANSAVDRALSISSEDSLPLDPYLGFAFVLARSGRFIVANNLDDINEAIEMAEDVIRSIPPQHPWAPKLWMALGPLHKDKSRFVGDTGEYDGLSLQLHAFSEAMKRVRPDHSLWVICNGNYAVALFHRFVSHSNLEDLQETIVVSRAVVSQIVANGYRDQFAWGYVSNLSNSLVNSYAQFGNLDALDEAIALQLGMGHNLALTLRHVWFWHSGQTYYMRYVAHGRMRDLECAISLHEQALTYSSGPYLHFMEVSAKLAQSLLARFERLGQPDDLDKAVSVLRIAVDHPQQDYKGSAYSVLGHALLKKGIVARNTEDVEESIQCQLKALEIFTETHSERSLSHHRLGLAQYSLFVLTSRLSSLQNAISAYMDGLSCLPSDHPNRAEHLVDLATAQLAAANADGRADLTSTLRILGEAAIHSQSWPGDRYAAAALWARTAHQAGDLTSALDAYRLALSLLPQVAWLGLEDELRLHRLSQQPPDISQDAAACAAQLGLYSLAVELIDGSRSIMWNTSQELRAELGRLREVAPDIARELGQKNAALAFRPGSTTDGQDDVHHEAERRRIHRLATRRTELLHMARSIPGFHRFLLPPSYADLHLVSKDGPVVILISSTYRCDALILHADTQLTLVPLPYVTHRLVMARAETLQKALQLTRDQKGRDFLDRILLRILRDLWDRIGKPIWIALGQPTPTCSTPNLPRIWWCPTGALTLLPVHACGPYNGIDPNMPDLFVSSYTPTLAALLRSRHKDDLSQPRSLPRVLVVCQPDTPNRPPLPCALEEARVLYSLIPSLCTFRIGQEGTVARVQEMLRDHSWLHVSTHGSQDSQRPLESSIALYDGDLKLSDLAQERMPNADFAFLSACHSARGTHSLPDEAMHLAAGFMFAGFKSVVATSWAIADKDAPVVAKGFYEHLIREGKTPEVTETAEALHVAVKQLRDSGVPLHRWVPFIHLGA